MASRRSNEVVSDKARRAVSEFRKLQPTLTAFARVLTGNPKVRVIASTGVPRTDGKDIFIQPPIELGEQRQHDRALCDQRDWDTMQQMCPACCVREEVMATTYHEISHIAFESFAAPDASRLKEALGYVRQVSTPKQAERIIRRIAESTEIPKSYMALASVINPYFKLLANSLEDVRINTRMHRARPGTKPMMDAQLLRVMTDGITKPDGTVVRWTEMHLNHQASIGGYLYASGFEPQSGWLADEVVTALKDDELRELLVLVADTADAHEAFTASWGVFSRLRELGFYQLKEEEKDNEPEPEEQDEPTPPKPPTPPQPQQSSDDQDDSDDASADGDSASGGSSATESEADEDDDSDESSEQPEEDADDSGEVGDSREEDGRESEDDSEDEGAPSSGDDDGEADEPESEEDAGDSASVGEGDDTDSSDPTESEDGENEEADSTTAESADADEVEEDAGDSDGSNDSQPGDGGEVDDGGDADSDGSDGSEDHEGPETGEGGTSFRVEPDEAAEDEDIDLGDLGLHQHHDDTSPVEEKAIEVAIVQGEHFEKPSTEINGVKEWWYESANDDAFNRPYHAWSGRQLSARDRRMLSGELDLPSETVLGPALMRMRVVFAENKRTQRNRNQRSGRLDTHALAKRAPFGDDRLFGKKVVPAKRDYMVLIMIDVSGSTAMGGGGKANIRLIKEAAMGQAELCARTGVPFEILAHTGAPANQSEMTGWEATNKNLWLDIYHIKDADQPWDDKARQRLMDIGPSYYNLDGHTLEYARRRIEQHRATDKVILYYSDGKMPLENYYEELEILQREIATCKQKNITLLGVGIRTDSPAQHGLDTVQVDDSSDIGRVVQHLERRLVV